MPAAGLLRNACVEPLSPLVLYVVLPSCAVGPLALKLPCRAERIIRPATPAPYCCVKFARAASPGWYVGLNPPGGGAYPIDICFVSFRFRCCGTFLIRL